MQPLNKEMILLGMTHGLKMGKHAQGKEVANICMTHLNTVIYYVVDVEVKLTSV